jgi:hypothetical protein
VLWWIFKWIDRTRLGMLDGWCFDGMCMHGQEDITKGCMSEFPLIQCCIQPAWAASCWVRMDGQIDGWLMQRGRMLMLGHRAHTYKLHWPFCFLHCGVFCGWNVCMFLILSRMHWIPQLMCSRKHDFELAPRGNFEISPVRLVFQRHAGLLQLACMVLYIRPTALPREPAGPAWYMDALWSGGGYSNSVARCRRMFWDNAEKWWCSNILEVEPF